MSKIVKISEIIGDNLAVTADKGEKVFEVLKQNIENNEESILDFTGITDLISAFSNVALGKLYDISEPSKLNELIKVKPDSLHPDDRKTIEKSLKNSKKKRELDKNFQKRLLDNLENGVEVWVAKSLI